MVKMLSYKHLIDFNNIVHKKQLQLFKNWQDVHSVHLQLSEIFQFQLVGN